MEAHRIKTTVEQNGLLTLKGLPLSAGDRVEVIILTETRVSHEGVPYPLRGTPVTYTDPFEPVAADEWESVR